jgi:GNAT superfamily N-acetyltransferase
MWTTRRASKADRGRLVALCHAAVGEDDYVPAFVDEFLRTGAVFAAEDAGQIIGMMVYHDVPDGSAWLHAARTDPDYRRQGVATALMADCERLASEQRRSALRLWAAASNRASVDANQKYGFRERARFSRMRAPASKSGETLPLRPLTLSPSTWLSIANSSLLRKTSSYVFHEFYFLPLTRTNARWLARDEALWRLGPNGLSISDDYEEPSGKDLQVQLLFGDPAKVLSAAPAIARARGATRVESFLPHDSGLLETARRAGFAPMEWGQEAILFEKPLLRRARSIGSARAGTTR